MYPNDYEEFLESLNTTGARYLVVGAYAVAFHSQPRATKDLDVFVEPTPENVERVIAAIRRFLGTDLGITKEDLNRPGEVVQLGVSPLRIDLLSSLAGRCPFSQAWERRTEGFYGAVKAHFLSLDDLIAEKKCSDREQDRADVTTLLRAKSRNHKP